MGQIKAKLDDQISIAQALRDLQRESGDSESDVLRLLADLVLSAERGAHRLDVSYSRRAVPLAPLEIRLREAARDGWTPRARSVYIGDEKRVPVSDITIKKRSLIRALEIEQITVPKSWTGSETAAEKNQRILAREKELRTGGDRSPLQTIAREERVTVSRIKQRIARAKKSIS